jgi:pimeloyl-ACP methyl ester carboxylesterase
MSAPRNCRPSKYLITLIHGTFARDADWAGPGSEFQTALQERLREPASFRTFNWSGANSHDARKRAGAELAAHIRQLGQENPGWPHVLVAHSHGGNVACYALEDPEARRNVVLIVTLGTPFIQCRVRRIGGTREVSARHPAGRFRPGACDRPLHLGLYGRERLLQSLGRHARPDRICGRCTGFLRGKCSCRDVPKQAEIGARMTHHRITLNRAGQRRFLARSEGCRTRPRPAHNPKVAGSNPAPAIS